MASQHWTPPNRGKNSMVTSLSHGQFPTMPECSGATFVRPSSGKTAAKPGFGKSGDVNAQGRKANRKNVLLHPESETYGPAGEPQVYRSYSNVPGTTGRQVRTMGSSFGEQDNFRGGSRDGA